MSDNNWVNFAEIRSRISLEDVILRYYKIDGLKKDGTKLIGACPVHGGDSPRAFHAELEKNIWHCFSKCKKGGNQIDFVAAKEGITIRDAALKLQAFFLGAGSTDRRTTTPQLSPDSQATPSAPQEKVSSPTSVTKPPEEDEGNPILKVNLEVKGDHPHLIQDRALKVETVNHFGLGYCGRGIMKGMIAIPIHDEENALVAYAGRRLKYADIHDFGKYKFPKGFKKDLVLYNLNRARQHLAELGYLIVVEGFFSVVKLFEMGFPNVVAVMGSDVSEAQGRLLTETKEVIILFDGDDAGWSGALLARERLAKNIAVRLARLPKGAEPESLSPRALRWLVNGLRQLDLAEVAMTNRADVIATAVPPSDTRAAT